MQLGVGAPSLTFNIQDFSPVNNTGIKGICGMLIVTERGDTDVRHLVGSWEQYQTAYGGLMPDYDGPLYAKRALEAGAKLLVQRAMRYGNPADKASILSVAASLEDTQTAGAAAGAHATFTFVATSATTSCNIFAQIPGQSDSLLGTVSLDSSITDVANVTALVAAITAGTATHHFTAAAGTAGAFTITCPVTMGSSGNAVTIRISVDATLAQFSAYSSLCTGGKDTTVAGAKLVMVAKNPGAWGNAITVEARLPISGAGNKRDIIVTLVGSTVVPQEFYRDVAMDTTGINMTSILGTSQLVSSAVATGGYILQLGVLPFSGGTDDNIVDPEEYIGDQVAGTNLYGFDEETAMNKISIPEVADTSVMETLANYADFRQDVIALHRSPIGITPDNTVMFRRATGPYSGNAVDSWHSFLFAGGLTVTDPLTGNPKNISEIGDVIGAISRKDNNYFEWTAFAGELYGKISGATNVVVNVGTPGNKTAADAYDVYGIIPVVKKMASTGLQQIRIEGNTSMWATNNLLKKSEVAELVVYIVRMLNRIVPPYFFQPNDTITWKSIYRDVAQQMEFIQANRGIWDYIYQGDQDIDNISQAVINNPTEIAQGIYKFNLLIAPIVALKYVYVTLGVSATVSGVTINGVTVNTLQ